MANGFSNVWGSMLLEYAVVTGHVAELMGARPWAWGSGGLGGGGEPGDRAQGRARSPWAKTYGHQTFHKRWSPHISKAYWQLFF